MKLGEVAASVGKGPFAGVVGTVAMTVSSTLEMKIRGRQGSSAPAEAAGKVLGRRAHGRGGTGPLLEPGPLGLRDILGRSPGAHWRDQPRRTQGHGGALPGCVGLGAGHAAGLGCRPALLAVGREGSSHRRLSPPRVRGRNRRRLRHPGPLTSRPSALSLTVQAGRPIEGESEQLDN